MAKKVAFYMDYDKYGRNEAPGILLFVQLLRDKGYEVDFITSEQELLHKLEHNRYDAVAVSAFSSLELRDILKTAIKIKKQDPCIVTILGGHGASTNAQKLSHATGIDVVVEGEAENSLPLILKNVERAEVPAIESINDRAELDLTQEQIEFLGIEAVNLLLMDRVYYRSPITKEQAERLINSSFERITTKDGEQIKLNVPLSGVIFSTRDGNFFDMSKITKSTDHSWTDAHQRNKLVWEKEHSKKFPLILQEFIHYMHLHPTDEEWNKQTTKYPWDIVKEKNWTNISLYVQKGCSWRNCAFCGVTTVGGRRLKVKSKESLSVIQMLEEARDNGIKAVTFDDDEFVQDQEWVKELCNEIMKRKLNEKLVFSAMIRVESIKRTQLSKHHIKKAINSIKGEENKRIVSEMLKYIEDEGLNNFFKELNFGGKFGKEQAIAELIGKLNEFLPESEKIALNEYLSDKLIEHFLLQLLKDANFIKLQIGVESFVPEKIKYFQKTREGKEEKYIEKAKELIRSCLEADIIPGIFVITTRPKQKRALSEIAEELKIISSILKESYEKYNIIPIFSFNDMLMAYPGAPLLKKEGIKKFLAPLRPVIVAKGEKVKIEIETLEIPYIFKLKNMALTNFISNLFAISKSRKLPPEELNETIEHIKDATSALEISAKQLGTLSSIIYEFIRELGSDGRFAGEQAAVKLLIELNEFLPEWHKITLDDGSAIKPDAHLIGHDKSIPDKLKKLLVRNILTPENVVNAIKNTQNNGNKKMLEFINDEVTKQQLAEKDEVLDKCGEINRNILDLENSIDENIKKYLSQLRDELEKLNEIRDTKIFAQKINEMCERTKDFIEKVFPSLKGRTTLNSVINWLSTYSIKEKIL
ncbi:MAG: cobalamin-dependent protein [Euryarchaeota archaeon]|nr:cobalamin-dependent protein [Euryarchaeota archaeon]